MELKNCSFYANTQYGYILKILVEVLNNCLTNEICFTLSKDGISCVCEDKNETLMIDFNLKMENFDDYKYDEDEPKTISIKLTQFLKLLKIIKKKDSLSLFIRKDSPHELGIKIMSMTSVSKKNEKNDISYITINEVQIDQSDKIDYSFYHQPKVIPAIEYQKMCKRMSVIPTNVIKIKIQENNYICFSSEKQAISATIEFGELDDKKHIYDEEFPVSLITQFVKMSGLHNSMQIYSPKIEEYPLRIKMASGNLGIIEVFIKTKKMIEIDEYKRKNLQ